MKAVIVIDVDDNIKLDRTYIAYDLYDGDNMDVISKVIGYGYAPLRPLPKKKTEEEEMAKDPFNEDLFYDEYIWGWNACLDAITGENK